MALGEVSVGTVVFDTIFLVELNPHLCENGMVSSLAGRTGKGPFFSPRLKVKKLILIRRYHMSFPPFARCVNVRVAHDLTPVTMGSSERKINLECYLTLLRVFFLLEWIQWHGSSNRPPPF